MLAYHITDDCINCGVCASECPVEAISEGDGKHEIDPEKCTECGACAEVCPTEAVSPAHKRCGATKSGSGLFPPGTRSSAGHVGMIFRSCNMPQLQDLLVQKDVEVFFSFFHLHSLSPASGYDGYGWTGGLSGTHGIFPYSIMPFSPGFIRTAGNRVQQENGLTPGKLASGTDNRHRGRISFTGWWVEYREGWDREDENRKIRTGKLKVKTGKIGNRRGTMPGVLLLLPGLLMAWVIGANDAANSLGTAVGSEVRTPREGAILAALFGLADGGQGRPGGQDSGRGSFPQDLPGPPMWWPSPL